jgi:hypothetical protein
MARGPRELNAHYTATSLFSLVTLPYTLFLIAALGPRFPSPGAQPGPDRGEGLQPVR